MIAKVTSKGQLTIPKPIRDQLSLHAGDKVRFSIEEGGVVKMTPVSFPITRLKGMLPKPSRSVSVEEMNAAIEEEGGRL